MHLTPAQKTQLKTHILANTGTVQALVAGQSGLQTVEIRNVTDIGDNYSNVAAWYNGLVSPTAFYLWRTNVSEEEFTQTTGTDVANANAPTNFTWVGNGFITRSVGEQTAWSRLFLSGFCNPSLANVRQAFTDILSGTGNAATNRNHMLVISKRAGTNAEKVFAGGVGTYAVPSTPAKDKNGAYLEGTAVVDEADIRDAILNG